MRTWKRLGIGLLMTTMLIGGGMASAQQGPAKEADPFQSLGLSTDQRNKLDAAQGELTKTFGKLRDKVVDSDTKLRKLLVDKKASDKEIDQAANQLLATQGEVLLAQVRFRKALRQILEQGQLTKLSQGNGK
ncbi:MAG: hypothetical protein F9K13_10915 [Candidatus Methylomirabilis oxygeniifera]|uniref:Periplasmic heavy metal sensor n=1 Tax=Methylomirabilis oxygeniifera TaxID=671143 RepID=D5MJP3_METO1|nr:MAG: hypothetical protein F9K13_10915 [Candidatus Methylomirabilis oxyfera]CBE69628.1 exported protein of unknown function [Candidatus Methylomirabilis oxyfera]